MLYEHGNEHKQNHVTSANAPKITPFISLPTSIELGAFVELGRVLRFRQRGDGVGAVLCWPVDSFGWEENERQWMDRQRWREASIEKCICWRKGAYKNETLLSYLTYVEGFSRSSEGVCALRTFVRAMKRQQQLRVVVVGLWLCLKEKKEWRRVEWQVANDEACDAPLNTTTRREPEWHCKSVQLSSMEAFLFKEKQLIQSTHLGHSWHDLNAGTVQR